MAILSQGVYRIPYKGGTTVKVVQDAQSHEPPGTIDLKATDGSEPYKIVAAADGVIRFIVDHFSENRPDKRPCNNNYVWIAHANGEWTKYSLMTQGSVTTDAGLSVGDSVTAGTFLGFEGNVGCTTEQRLHFEVAVPSDPSDPIDAEGFIRGGFARNRNPRICGISGNTFVKGTSHIARICQLVPVSQGVYRIPYKGGTTVKVVQDAQSHEPPGRIDLKATDGSEPYKIVAAADGFIQKIEDGFSANTPNEDPCRHNNYVWIAHANGEWTKYSHMTQGSVTTNAGLSMGDFVTAGTFLGFEDDVGCAHGTHLHFEVAVPTNPNPSLAIDSDGFIRGGFAVHRDPWICSFPSHTFAQGASHEANSCERLFLIEPSVITFSAALGETVKRTLTIANTLGTDVTVSIGARTSGPITWPSFNRVMAHGEWATVNLQFSPVTHGEVRTTLTINGSAPGSPHTVSLIGKGPDPDQEPP